jgi:hypothetical protein
MTMKDDSAISDHKIDLSPRRCSEVSLSALRSLLGRTVHRIYSPCLQIAGSHIASPSLSIPLTDHDGTVWIHHYVVIRCEWFETPDGNDFWQFLVAGESKPAGIEVDDQRGIIAPCTIEFFGASPVNKIEIYESNSHPKKFRNEGVSYDQAIRFCQESGKSFCIACQLNGPGIATEVSISEDDETIKSFLEDSRLRATIA